MKIQLPIALVVVVLSACGVGIESPTSLELETETQPVKLRKPSKDVLLPTVPTEQLTGFPCEVREVLQAACAGCHAQAVYFGSFYTRDDLAHISVTAHQRVTSATSPMPPYGANRQLSPQERLVLANWFEAGAPA